MNQKLENTFLTALEQNQQKLLRICSVYAEDNEDKKDLFQDVLINIWESMPDFEARSSLSTWMFRITLNVCLRLQSKRARKRDLFINLDGNSIGKRKAEERSNEHHQQLMQLRICIKKLNEADKGVITLYLEELPYKEISNITGLTENNVAVKLKRIKGKLLNCINKTS